MNNSIIQKINIKYIHYHNQQFLKYIWLQILNNTHFKVFIMLSYIYKYAYGFVYLLKKFFSRVCKLEERKAFHSGYVIY